MPRLESSKGRCRCRPELSVSAARARKVRANPPETGKGKGKDKNKHKSKDGDKAKGRDYWNGGHWFALLEVKPQTHRLWDSIGSTEKWGSGWRSRT